MSDVESDIDIVLQGIPQRTLSVAIHNLRSLLMKDGGTLGELLSRQELEDIALVMLRSAEQYFQENYKPLFEQCEAAQIWFETENRRLESKLAEADDRLRQANDCLVAAKAHLEDAKQAARGT